MQHPFQFSNNSFDSFPGLLDDQMDSGTGDLFGGSIDTFGQMNQIPMGDDMNFLNMKAESLILSNSGGEMQFDGDFGLSSAQLDPFSSSSNALGYNVPPPTSKSSLQGSGDSAMFTEGGVTSPVISSSGAMSSSSSRKSAGVRKREPRKQRNAKSSSASKASPSKVVAAGAASSSTNTRRTAATNNSNSISESTALEAFLEEANATIERQSGQLVKIQPVQRQLLDSPDEEAFQILWREEEELLRNISQQVSAILELEVKNVMSPSQLVQRDCLLRALDIQRTQLELLLEELRMLKGNGSGNGILAALVITAQPFPAVQTKNKLLDDADCVEVQLITAAGSEFSSLSDVKAEVIECESHKGPAANTENVIKDESASLNRNTRSASFRFRFTNGTRKMPVCIRFSMRCTTSDGRTGLIRSSPTSAFIVITNEAQYEECSGRLLEHDTFMGGVLSAPSWPSFVNRLQGHFLRGTRQDVTEPARALTNREIDFMHDRFFGRSNSVALTTFNHFWEWFGKVVRKLRYERHIITMWQSGLIYGFISRAEVHGILVDQLVGASLIRFSERHAGMLAVGYKVDEDDLDRSVRHYLITADDVSAKKTFPDFLGNSSQFETLCQLTGEICTDGRPRYRFVQKDVVLNPMYTKRTSKIDTEGYDTALNKASQQKTKQAAHSRPTKRRNK